MQSSHTYAAVGTYPVMLTVTDADGAAAATTQSVSVVSAITDATKLKFVLEETSCREAR